MQNIGISRGKVNGSKEQALPIVFGKDTVYVHENIKKVKGKEEYEYDEMQYTYMEYMQVLTSKVEKLEETIENLKK